MKSHLHVLTVKKEMITVVFCSYTYGTYKLLFLVISMILKPHTFKNTNVSSLPVYYRDQKSAWMDKDWFINEFAPKVKKILKRLKIANQSCFGIRYRMKIIEINNIMLTQ